MFDSQRVNHSILGSFFNVMDGFAPRDWDGSIERGRERERERKGGKEVAHVVFVVHHRFELEYV